MNNIYNSNTLMHHGVEGMSWGKRNGPPYPLSGIDKRIARAEAKRKKEQERRLEKARKAAKKKRKEESRAIKRQAKIDKMKLKLIEKGDLDKISRKSKYFTNDELEYAIRRRQAIDAAKPLKKESNLKLRAQEAKELKMQRTMQKLADAAIMAQRVGTIAQSAAQIASVFNQAKVNVDDATMRKLKISEQEFKKKQAIASAVKTMMEATKVRSEVFKQETANYKDGMDILRSYDEDAARRQVRQRFNVPAEGYEAHAESQRQAATNRYRSGTTSPTDWITSTTEFNTTNLSDIRSFGQNTQTINNGEDWIRNWRRTHGGNPRPVSPQTGGWGTGTHANTR